MNTDKFIGLLQQSFRVSVGATVSFIETLQDPQKRAETLSELQSQFTQKAQEWAQKGEITEQGARRLVEEWLNQQQRTQPSAPTTDNGNQKPTSSSGSNGNLHNEIEQLTQQVIALRTELENSRQSN